MPRYVIFAKRVLEQINEIGDPDLSKAVADTLELLAEDPYNDPPRVALKVLPYKDPDLSPFHFTVAVGHHGLLLYAVKQDYPWIVVKAFIGGDAVDRGEP